MKIEGTRLIIELDEWLSVRDTLDYHTIRKCDYIGNSDKTFVIKDRDGMPTHTQNGNPLPKKTPTMENRRTLIKPGKVHEAVKETVDKLFHRLDNDKGYGTLASTHEIYGLLAEEMHELTVAVHENADDAELKEELKDLAVGAIFAIACINSKTLDW